MAIDYIPYRDADNLARADEKGFYPLPLPISHWQLRNYISNPEPDVIYYASGSEVYYLNTATKKRKHIATIPFTARCTASGHGWVCIGGEALGDFAAIKLDGPVGSRPQDVDTALPVLRSNDSRGSTMHLDKIGKDYLNSISIHRIQDEEAHLDDIVAILTNNDTTVRVYSLPLGIETTKLKLPFAMNHATLSPDGKTIVVVGDISQAYFFARELNDTPPQIPKPHNRLTSHSLDWTLMSVVDLHQSGPDKTTGYFSTAWSPNGQLVAVGSESGYITVFDIGLLSNPDLADEDAIVAVTPSTRADVPPNLGAIRSMMFSPDPWDLLIWSEDVGRVCIGDLRTGLRSKQVLELEPHDDDLRKIEVEDEPNQLARAGDDLEKEFIRRYQTAPDHATATNYAAEYMVARRRQRLRHDVSLRSQIASGEPVDEDHPLGLTAREQQILESLRTARQREEGRAAGQIPRTVNYTTPDMFTTPGSRASRSGTPNNGSAGPTASLRAISDTLTSAEEAALHNTLPELTRTNAQIERPGSSHGPSSRHELALPALHHLNDSIWADSRSASGLVRLSDPSRLPRRRASIILALPGDPSSSSTYPQRITNQIPTSTPSPAAAEEEESRHHAAEEEDENDDDPWRTIENHMTLARGPLFESAARAAASAAGPEPPTASRPSNADLQNELALERARARTLARQGERWRSIRNSNDNLNPSTTNSNSNSSPAPNPASGANATRIAGFPDGYEALLQRSGSRTAAAGMLRRTRESDLAEAGARRENGVRTAGLAMSADGRTLWAACEEGIFEVGVNVKGRMFWGSVEPL